MKTLLFAIAVLPVCAQPVTVRLDGRVKTMPLEEYVAAVVAGESSTFRSDEALKAMAIAARTFAARLRGRHAKEGFDFCTTTHCQRVDPRGVTPRIENVTDATAGELLWFEGKPAFTCYSRNCGGRTQDAAAVWPGLGATYLRTQEDPYCQRSGRDKWQWTASPQEITQALRRAGLRCPDALSSIAKTGDRLLRLSGGNDSVAISPGALRFAVGRTLGWNTLRSDRFEVQSANGRFRFDGWGEGHGVGMCQRGADQMGADGHSYREILSFYYPGTIAGLTAKGLHWTRMGGETLAFMTTQPDRDGAVLPKADRLFRNLSQETGLPMPQNVEVRIYPDTEVFRNATAEPGWVAAVTTGTRIHVQHVDGTLRHELLHVLVETHAKPGLPVWFREGLVEYLSDRRESGALPETGDTALRQRSDEARARRAYGAANQRVAALVRRYDAATVLTWVTRGLPPELNSSINSQPATNSR